MFEAIEVLNNLGEGKIEIGKFGGKDLGHVMDTSSFILIPNEIIVKTLDVEKMETIGKEAIEVHRRALWERSSVSFGSTKLEHTKLGVMCEQKMFAI